MTKRLLLYLTILICLGLLAPPASLAEHIWPPLVGEKYPDLELTDHRGRRFKLSSLRGKLILVEPVGMPCKACQAFAGGHKKGGYQGVAPQPGIPSIEELLKNYGGGARANDRRLVVVQLLLYDMMRKAPALDDAKRWAKHFGLERKANHYVAVPTKDLRSNATFNMIPGFQLIDRSFVLRYDATGHNPKHNLYRDLIPALGKILNRR